MKFDENSELISKRIRHLKRLKRQRETYAGYQADTLDQVMLAGYTWCEIEDAAVMSNRLPLKNLALSLGRTYWAVTNRRAKLRRLAAQ